MLCFSDVTLYSVCNVSILDTTNGRIRLSIYIVVVMHLIERCTLVSYTDHYLTLITGTSVSKVYFILSIFILVSKKTIQSLLD